MSARKPRKRMENKTKRVKGDMRTIADASQRGATVPVPVHVPVERFDTVPSNCLVASNLWNCRSRGQSGGRGTRGTASLAVVELLTVIRVAGSKGLLSTCTLNVLSLWP